MNQPAPRPELTNAIVRGAVAEAILLVAAVALYLATDVIWWIFGAAILGSAVMLLLLAQAGAFERKDG